jgi:ribosomal-protein-alanine N-acetyltransferase
VAAALWPGAGSGARGTPQASTILAEDIAHWQRESFGPWVFVEAASGLFVGRGGLRRSTVAGIGCVEVLYAVRSDAWGEGYASEMAAVAVAYARRIGIGEVVGFAATSNRASLRVLEKVGMRYSVTFKHAGLPHRLGRLVLRAED